MGFVLLLLLAIVTVFLVNVVHSKDDVLHSKDDVLQQRRHRRNAIQMCDMINTYSPRHCLSYSAYGCFCGSRSWGSNPVDGSDRCCQQHDRCYSIVGCSNLPFLTYSYHCTSSSCLCTDSNIFSCQYRSCQCDVQLAQCLRDASYSIRYMFYRKRRCR